MKTIIAIIAASLALAGCATEVLSASEQTVVVRSRGTDYAAAQKLADAECKKYGKSARMVGRPNDLKPDFIYDCVR